MRALQRLILRAPIALPMALLRSSWNILQIASGHYKARSRSFGWTRLVIRQPNRSIHNDGAVLVNRGEIRPDPANGTARAPRECNEFYLGSLTRARRVRSSGCVSDRHRN